MTEVPMNARIAAREDLHENLCILRIQPNAGAANPFEPGQFVVIGLPKKEPEGSPAAARVDAKPRMVRRAYSIASSPLERRWFELLVVKVDEGRLSPRLFDMHPGDPIWIDERVRGEFTLEGVKPEQDVFFVATGTGIAPLLSMIRTFHGKGHYRRVALIHGVRGASDLAYRAELEELAGRDPSFRYIAIASREPEGSVWTGRRGRVQAVVQHADPEGELGFPLDPANCHIFMCGNPAMITDLTKDLEARGFVTHNKKRPGTLHVERYW